MNKPRVVVFAIFLAILATILPLLMMSYLSWIRAINEEIETLSLYAHRLIIRANDTTSQTAQTLYSTDKLNQTAACDTLFIESLRKMTMNSSTIYQIGYFDKDRLLCNSWGLTKGVEVQPKPDFRLSNGIGIALNIQPDTTNTSKKLMSLQYKKFNALIDPLQLTDIIVNSEIQLAVLTDKGNILSLLNSPDIKIINQTILHPRNHFDKSHLIAIEKRNGLIAVVMESSRYLTKVWLQQMMLLLPIGILISCAMVGLVIWLSRRRLSLVGELTIAIEKKEFIVYYQPIMDLKTRACIGAEALVRWQRSDGSFIQPNYFIPYAEESGLILAITDQVIFKVVEDLKNLLSENHNLHVAINLCADDIKTGRALPILDAALVNTLISKSQIWLEATERGFIAINEARETIKKAREMGYKVVIDDFGTGFSSLSYLQSLPLDALKIDKSFVDTITTESVTSSVTSHIIDMAKTLNLKIIAEGIETENQANYLQQHHVEYGQGYLFGKPMPPEEFFIFYKNN